MSHTLRNIFSAASIAFMSVLVASEPASAAQELPLKGTYQCVTTSWVQTGVAPNPRNQDERKKRGMNPLGSGDYAVSIPAPVGMMMAPAAFGVIVIEGNGKYRLPQMKQAGRYTYNPAKNDLRFTGDLSAMTLREFNPKNSSFVLTYKNDLAFQCGRLTNGSRPTVAAQGKPAVQAQPARPAPDLNGVFDGALVCNGASAPLQLNLTTHPMGSITGTVTIGAGGSAQTYTVEGNRSSAGFYLTPTFASMMARSGTLFSITGRLSDDILYGKVDSANCAAFTTTRRKSSR